MNEERKSVAERIYSSFHDTPGLLGEQSSAAAYRPTGPVFETFSNRGLR